MFSKKQIRKEYIERKRYRHVKGKRKMVDKLERRDKRDDSCEREGFE